MSTIIISANPGFEIIFGDHNKRGYTKVPIIAWRLEGSDSGPQPITVDGLYDTSETVDVGICYPNGTILHHGKHYADTDSWRVAVEALSRERSLSA